jgi:hypothetical protein
MKFLVLLFLVQKKTWPRLVLELIGLSKETSREQSITIIDKY